MIDRAIKISLWQQFGAAIDFLELSIEACPDEQWHASLWQTPDTYEEFSHFWYVAYHTLFWLDVYLIGTEDGFEPPEPFTLIEMDYDSPPPERPYTKVEVLNYLKHGRAKCKATIEGMTDEIAQRHCAFGWGECSFYELQLYNMRHVMMHAAQLNMLLGQQVGEQRSWVAKAK